MDKDSPSRDGFVPFVKEGWKICFSCSFIFVANSKNLSFLKYLNVRSIFLQNFEKTKILLFRVQNQTSEGKNQSYEALISFHKIYWPLYKKTNTSSTFLLQNIQYKILIHKIVSVIQKKTANDIRLDVLFAIEKRCQLTF